jgi:hypothetical protein
MVLLSDQKLKQDIEDASSQWEDVKALQFRKYRWKHDVESLMLRRLITLGVIAQELDSIWHERMIEESPDSNLYEKYSS